MRIVMKFGGTSVADGSKIKNVASLIKRFYDEKNEVIIVVSALSGVTDQLEKIARKASEDGGITDVKAFIEYFRDRHYAVVQEAVAEGEIKVVIEELDARLNDLENALISICHLRELTARSHDYLSSFGERLSAPILSASLKSMNLRSIALTGGDAGIVTDSNFTSARPLLDTTYAKVKERIFPLLEKKIIPVITGFVAADAKGIITTLSRGGSDYTAALIGAAIDADEIWIWTDVDGIMTADPKIISEARTLPTISYLEAMELSYFGAKVLHPKTIEPAVQKGITVRVRNTFNPEYPGTLIIKAHEHIKDIVKAVTLIQNIALINISGSGMAGNPGVAGRVFSALGRIGANIMMISQGSSEANISLVIDKTQLDASLHALQTEFNENIIKDISYDENVCVIAVVGDGMAGNPGVAGRVFSALGRIGANIMMISQGSSEANIS
ncbi:MAG TPA: aspartate kinase, partial [Methanocellales archaeon]|nr:aspartate kinase [Methanocellales archaeon]